MKQNQSTSYPFAVEKHKELDNCDGWDERAEETTNPRTEKKC